MNLHIFYIPYMRHSWHWHVFYMRTINCIVGTRFTILVHWKIEKMDYFSSMLPSNHPNYRTTAPTLTGFCATISHHRTMSYHAPLPYTRVGDYSRAGLGIWTAIECFELVFAWVKLVFIVWTDYIAEKLSGVYI